MTSKVHVPHMLTLARSGFQERATDPLVILGLLYGLTLLNGNRFNGYYLVLALLTFFISYHVFKLAQQYAMVGRARKVFAAQEVMLSWVAIVLILAVIGYLTGFWNKYSGKVMLAWFVLTPGILLLRRSLLRQGFSASTVVPRSAIIVGVNELSLKLHTALGRHSDLRMDMHGFFDDRSEPRLNATQRIELLGSMAEVAGYVRTHHIHAIYISQPMSAQPRVLRLLDELKDTTASIYFLPDFVSLDPIQARLDYVGDVPVMAICDTPFVGVNSLIKRLSDIVLACLILLLLTPLLCAVALAVKLSSPGPIIFRQRRYGLDGEEIIVYKFRSMTVCEDGAKIVQARQGDQRMTPIGAFLRRTSLDELPQFINVLQGRMSIVGPRPHAVAHNEMYRKLIKGYMQRHKVRPGITGWAQVNGLRGETETLEKMAARIEYDLDYLKRWSLWLDIWVIFRTVKVVLARENAY